MSRHQFVAHRCRQRLQLHCVCDILDLCCRPRRCEAGLIREDMANFMDQQAVKQNIDRQVREVPAPSNRTERKSLGSSTCTSCQRNDKTPKHSSNSGGTTTADLYRIRALFAEDGRMSAGPEISLQPNRPCWPESIRRGYSDFLPRAGKGHSQAMPGLRAMVINANATMTRRFMRRTKR